MSNCFHQTEIRAVIIGCGIKDNVAQLRRSVGEHAKDLNTVPIVHAQVGDAALGGCMFSAGELDSSKNYIQQPDGTWRVAFQVSPIQSLHVMLVVVDRHLLSYLPKHAFSDGIPS
jgi:hypothetical protein